MSEIDLTVVIVSFNARAVLQECLSALPAAAGGFATEVFVVDNGSSDGSVEMVRHTFPSVLVIENGRNLGFSRANNLALSRARGRQLLLLNSDTLPQEGSLAALIRFLDSHPEAGVAAPRLLNTDFSDQGTARSFPTIAAALFGRRSLLTRLAPRNRWSRRYLVGRWHAGEEPFPVDWVSGACLMVSRSAYQVVGGLDEGFFMYWEDADWCRRIKSAGFHVYCVPRAVVVHHEGRSRRGWPPRQVWAFHRSVYRYYAKHKAVGPWSLTKPVVSAALAARAALIVTANQARGSRIRIRMKRGESWT